MYNDAQNPYEHEEDVMGENICMGNVEMESNGRIFQDTPLDFAATMRILRVEMQCYGHIMKGWLRIKRSRIN